MEIEVSATLLSRAMINPREYFRFPDPKYPSTSPALIRAVLALFDSIDRVILGRSP